MKVYYKEQMQNRQTEQDKSVSGSNVLKFIDHLFMSSAYIKSFVYR